MRTVKTEAISNALHPIAERKQYFVIVSDVRSYDSRTHIDSINLRSISYLLHPRSTLALPRSLEHSSHHVYPRILTHQSTQNIPPLSGFEPNTSC